jgi:hypothetical protein
MTVLIREDTGEIAVVRVIDPGVHVSAPYSRAVGLLDKWVTAERRAVDEFAAWVEGQAAQAHAEMRHLCDELGLPVAWAEVPELAEGDVLVEAPGDASYQDAYEWQTVQPISVKRAELPADPSNQLAPERLDREYALNNMVALGRRGWTPQRPVITDGMTVEEYDALASGKPPPSRWSAEWAAFRADVKDMARDLRRSLTWRRKEEN